MFACIPIIYDCVTMGYFSFSRPGPAISLFWISLGFICSRVPMYIHRCYNIGFIVCVLINVTCNSISWGHPSLSFSFIFFIRNLFCLCPFCWRTYQENFIFLENHRFSRHCMFRRVSFGATVLVKTTIFKNSRRLRVPTRGCSVL